MEENKIPGWKDATVSIEMPLSMLVNFLNILNQRVATLEDNVLMTTEDGRQMTVSAFYDEVTRAQQEAQAKEQENQGE